VSTPHILIVDDTPANLRLAEVLLTGAGFVVTCAEDAPAAARQIDVGRPDLILLDIQLPGMDGLTFAGRLRRDPSTRDIPVVAMTAYAMRGDRERMLAAGCVGYLSKPISPATFADEVRGFLSGAGTERES
jgi:CheY-like chemotaxis protein